MSEECGSVLALVFSPQIAMSCSCRNRCQRTLDTCHFFPANRLVGKKPVFSTWFLGGGLSGKWKYVQRWIIFMLAFHVYSTANQLNHKMWKQTKTYYTRTGPRILTRRSFFSMSLEVEPEPALALPPLLP